MRGVLSAPPRIRAALNRLYLVGGGTGGHLMPGLALAERARERFPEIELYFFRTRRKIEDQIFSNSPAGLLVRELDLSPPGRTPLSWLRFIRRCLRAKAEIRAELRRCRPDALVALGGYPCLPGILAARQEGVPLILLEQNRTPGKVVKLLARAADAVACPDHHAADALRARIGRRTATRIVSTGNPVRGTVLRAREARREARQASREMGGADRAHRTVMVVGGSQGATALNRAVLATLPSLAPYRDRISWIHVAGSADREEVEQAYLDAGWRARVFAFTHDLPALLAEADLALARAGGTTVAELTALGVPSILVPYPHHRDFHQLSNALAMVESGAACLVPERRLGPLELRRLFVEILFDEDRLRIMEEGALAAGKPEAGDAVLDLILQVSREGAS